MASVRLGPELEARLRAAARITGKPMSAIIRTAVEEHCNALLQDRLDYLLADVIGIIHSEGGQAEDTGRAFVEVLQKRLDKAKR
jgi:predicted DNA-binding protein